MLIFSSSFFKLCLSPLHLLTIKLIFCCEIKIFSFLKKVAVNLESVSSLSGYIGIQISSSFFSNNDLSLDFFQESLN